MGMGFGVVVVVVVVVDIFWAYSMEGGLVGEGVDGVK